MHFPRQLANLDRAVALERVGGDDSLLREIAALFLEECPQLMAEIRAALDVNDPAAVERAAHTLKGSVGNFGAQAAVDASLRLEMLGRSRDLANAEDAWCGLKQEMDLLRPSLMELINE